MEQCCLLWMDLCKANALEWLNFTILKHGYNFRTKESETRESKVLTWNGRGLDDRRRAEEGGSVGSGGDGGVEVSGSRFWGLVGGALGPERGWRTATGLLDREPRVETSVEAEDTEVLCRGGRLGQQEVVLMGRQSVEPVHDHGRLLRRAGWTSCNHTRQVLVNTRDSH